MLAQRKGLSKKKKVGHIIWDANLLEFIIFFAYLPNLYILLEYPKKTFYIFFFLALNIYIFFAFFFFLHFSHFSQALT